MDNELTLDNEIACLESIALHIECLISSDNDSVSNTEHYTADLETIEKKIDEKKLEQVMEKIPQIENQDGFYQLDKCMNCGDTRQSHARGKFKCNAFSTCKCEKFIELTMEAVEMPFGDIET